MRRTSLPRLDLLALAAAVGAAGTMAGMAFERRRTSRRARRTAAGKELGFLSLLSHELKTPLNIALGYLDLVEMECGDMVSGTSRGYLSSCRRSLRQLVDVLENLLTWSGLMSGSLHVGLEPVELGALCRSAGAYARRAAEEKGLALDMRLPDEERWVYGDPPNLEHILRNLLSNAVKFTESGGVELSLEPEPDEIRIHVSDTGVGLTAAEAEQAFEPFWQADRSVTRRHGGAGLGLAVSRRLARLLGGDIRVLPRRGAGAVFQLRVPASPASPRRKGAS